MQHHRQAPALRVGPWDGTQQTRTYRHTHRRCCAGSPWADAKPASIVIVVSTQRGASTELAELIGSHPCGASFNELLKRDGFPFGYSRYVNDSRSYRDFLNVSKLQKAHWLHDARDARSRFCAARPAAVAHVCGDVCTISLKMHLNSMVRTFADQDWIRLVLAEDVRAVVVERNALQVYCSIQRAKATLDWGHTPEAHRPHSTWNLTHLCSGTDFRNQAWHFATAVRARFKATRAALSSVGRPFLELPFGQYVANQSGGAARVLAFAGLQQPPASWRGACGLPWCRSYSWPVHDE